MPTISLNRNLASLLALRKLDENVASVNQSRERLSSGQRINRASDDSAGLAVSSSLNLNARVYGQAVRNLNDGISAANIADSTLGDLSGIVDRLTELASTAANGAYTITQRRTSDAEAASLVKEYNRLLASANFNGTSLLNSGVARLSIQTGYGSSGQIGFEVGRNLTRTVANTNTAILTTLSLFSGSGTAAQSIVADLNGDGVSDIVTSGTDAGSSSFTVSLGTGGGNFAAGVSYSVATLATSMVLGDFNGDGKLDVAVSDTSDNKIYTYRNNGSGGFVASANVNATGPGQLAAADFNGDGRTDLAFADSSGNLRLSLGSSGGVTAAVTKASGLGTVGSLSVTDLNNDGFSDIVASSTTGVSSLLGSGTGNFGTLQFTAVASATGDSAVGDYNHDGYVDVLASTSAGVQLLAGKGDGTLATGTLAVSAAGMGAITAVDFDEDGNLDFFDRSGLLRLGDGNGGFSRTYSLGVNPGQGAIAVGDLNGDGAIDTIALKDNNSRLYFSRATQTDTIARLDLTTQSAARDALTALTDLRTSLGRERGSLGASISRLGSALSTSTIFGDGYEAASGRITDVDMAFETTQLIRSQILQSSATAILASANQQSKLVLKLLDFKAATRESRLTGA